MSYEKDRETKLEEAKRKLEEAMWEELDLLTGASAAVGVEESKTPQGSLPSVSEANNNFPPKTLEALIQLSFLTQISESPSPTFADRRSQAQRERTERLAVRPQRRGMSLPVSEDKNSARQNGVQLPSDLLRQELDNLFGKPEVTPKPEAIFVDPEQASVDHRSQARRERAERLAVRAQRRGMSLPVREDNNSVQQNGVQLHIRFAQTELDNLFGEPEVTPKPKAISVDPEQEQASTEEGTFSA